MIDPILMLCPECLAMPGHGCTTGARRVPVPPHRARQTEADAAFARSGALAEITLADPSASHEDLVAALKAAVAAVGARSRYVVVRATPLIEGLWGTGPFGTPEQAADVAAHASSSNQGTREDRWCQIPTLHAGWWVVDLRSVPVNLRTVETATAAAEIKVGEMVLPPSEPILTVRLSDPQVALQIIKGACGLRYTVNGHTVPIEDYLAVVATLRVCS